MNSLGVHAKTSMPSSRPPVSGTSSGTPRLGGAQKRTLGNGAGSTPIAAHPSAASSAWVNSRFGLSSHSRSSPFTLKTSTRRFAAPSPSTPGDAVSTRKKNSANDVFVATPDIPAIDM